MPPTAGTTVTVTWPSPATAVGTPGAFGGAIGVTGAEGDDGVDDKPYALASTTKV